MMLNAEIFIVQNVQLLKSFCFQCFIFIFVLLLLQLILIVSFNLLILKIWVLHIFIHIAEKL